MILYEVRNTINDFIYVGITKGKLQNRWRAHKCCVGKLNYPMYNAMNKYGFDKFTISIVNVFPTYEELLNAEKALVQHYKDLGTSYNIVPGGIATFPIVNVEEWKAKLSKSRKGRTPALGMKHTEENKQLFSKCGKLRWDIYGRYPQEEVLKLSCIEAIKKFGISRTHYYRLKKLAGNNETC